MVVVAAAFSSLAKISGECLISHSLPVDFFPWVCGWVVVGALACTP